MPYLLFAVQGRGSSLLYPEAPLKGRVRNELNPLGDIHKVLALEDTSENLFN